MGIHSLRYRNSRCMDRSSLSLSLSPEDDGSAIGHVAVPLSLLNEYRLIISADDVAFDVFRPKDHQNTTSKSLHSLKVERERQETWRAAGEELQDSTEKIIDDKKMQ